MEKKRFCPKVAIRIAPIIVLGLLLVAVGLLTSSSHAQNYGGTSTGPPEHLAVPTFSNLADTCLQQVGKPYETDDKACIKVKNTCDEMVAVNWEVKIYNFGLRAPLVDTKTGTMAIEPGKTADICVPKPKDKGTYCFRFEVSNRDKQHQADRIRDWLNNIKVAVLPGRAGFGTFTVGGSEEVTTTIALEPSDVPSGWALELSTYEVPPAEFPAVVTWTVRAAEDALPGQVVTLTVNGYDQVHPDPVGWVNLVVTVDHYRAYLPFAMRDYPGPPVAGFTSNSPVELGQPVVFTNTTIGASPLTYVWDFGDEMGTSYEVNPIYTYETTGTFTVTLTASNPYGSDDFSAPVRVKPVDLSPVPVLWYPEVETGIVAGYTFLMAWDESGEGDIEHVLFEYRTGDLWVEIGDEEDRPIHAQLGGWLVGWDTTPLPAGDYPVRVTMTDASGKQGVDEIIVHVAKEPVAEAQAEFLEYGTVLFDGSPSYDPDGTVVSWGWNFGDNTTGSGVTITHTYTDPERLYYATLTVTDTDGYQDTAYYQVIPGELMLFDIVRDCGCKVMDVNIAGNSNMPMWWMTNPLNRTLGAYNTIPSPPPPGGGPYYVIYNFEVEAELKPGSDPALCNEGQWVKGTFHYDARTGHKRHGGVNYPYTGAVLGPDDYFAPSNVKQHAGLTIRWVDGPGFGTPSQNIGLSAIDVTTSGAQGVTWNSKFFAMVSGPSGTCKCTWEVEWKIAKNGAVVIAPQVKNKHCTSTDP